jgi:ABC-2 type transport system permease protein
LAGFWKLARGIVRRDKVRLLVWLVAVPAVTIPSLGAYGEMFETPESAAARAALMATPTGTVFGGPGYGLDNYTTGPMIANELLLWLNLTVALAAILLVVHMTRREEETGRLELVGAAAVGRQAPLAAALAVVGLEVVLIGLALGVGCLVAYPELAPADCLAFGWAIGAVGLAFLAVGAVAAQVAVSGRGAGALACAVLGLAFLARAAGDTAAVRGDPDWASWLSPLGWTARSRVFVDLRLWPILLIVAFALVVGAAAWLLAARRDLGAGLIEARPGPAEAARSLLSPSGLVWRRTKGSFLAWAGGATLLALCMAPVMGSLGDYLEDNPLLAEVLGVPPEAGLDALTEAFSGVIVLYMAMLMGAYAVAAVNQLRADELAGLTARALAEPVSRLRLLGAAEVTVGACALMGMGLAGVVYCAVVAADSSAGLALAGSVAGSALRAFPALIATVALASCLAAGFPRLAALSWLPFAYAFVHMIVGEVLGLPSWTRFLSQFTALPLSPAADFEWGPALALGALAVVLFWLAHRRFQARDLLA